MQTEIIRVEEVRSVLDCSTGKAYKIIKQLNDELRAKGYITVAGRVSRTYFEKRCMIQGGQHAQ